MKKNKNIVSAFLYLFIFIFIYFSLNPFVFNASTNNIEELPYLYKLLGFAPFTQDELVQYHTNQYTQITPYISLIVLLAKVFSLKDLLFLFFILYLITVSLLYISFKKVYKSISNTPDILIVLFIVLFNLILKIYYIIPNNRTLFFDFFDPEFITYPFLFFTIAFHISRNYYLSFLCLFLGTILHPLYTIPLLPAMLVCTIYDFYKKNIDEKLAVILFSLYSLAVIPYTLFLWLTSKQTINCGYDISFVPEILRGTHHHKIPLLFSLDRNTSTFFLFSILLSTIGYFIHKKKNKLKSMDSLLVINFSLIGLLLSISFIAEFARVPILVQLTPYRIGIVITVLSWILFTSSISNFFSRFTDKLNTYSSLVSPLVFIIVLVLFLSTLPNQCSDNISYDSQSRNEVISWINKNTSKDDLFLNYSDLDIRTEVLRSDYFNLRTCYLTGDGQILWYRRMLIYFNIPSNLPENDFFRIRDTLQNKHLITIRNVIQRSRTPIKYIILTKDKRNFSEVANLLNYKNENYTYNTDGLKNLFENKIYIVYKKIEATK